MRINILIVYITCFATLMVNFDAFCQISTKVNLSNPYAKRITEVKDTYKETKKYRKQLKDSLKAVRKMDRIYKHKIDSMVQNAKKSTSELTGNYIPPIDTSMLSDSTSYFDQQWHSLKEGYDVEAADSLSLLKYNQYVDSLNKDFNPQQYITDSKARKAQLDSLGSRTYLQNQTKSLLDDQSKQLENSLASRAGADALPSGEVASMGANPLASQAPPAVPNLSNKKNLKQIMQKNMSGRISQYSNAISEAHSSMAKLKKKYSTIPSLGDLSTATKRSSLKGIPLKKRLRLGGNFHLQQTNTINLDFSPSLAYRLNRNAAVGLEVVYRSQFGGDQEWADAFDPSMYGGRIFFDMVLYKSFYARADVESLHQVETDQITEDPTPFISGALAGLGRVFDVADNVNGRVSIQYNFLHRDHGPYTSPWVLRFGFELKKLGKERIGIGNLKKK